VQWRQLAQDLQMLAETQRPTADFLERLAMIEARDRATKMLQRDYGVTQDELKLAFQYFKDRIETYSKRGLTDGFRRIDNDHKGSLQVRICAEKRTDPASFRALLSPSRKERAHKGAWS